MRKDTNTVLQTTISKEWLEIITQRAKDLGLSKSNYIKLLIINDNKNLKNKEVNV